MATTPQATHPERTENDAATSGRHAETPRARTQQSASVRKGRGVRDGGEGDFFPRGGTSRGAGVPSREWRGGSDFAPRLRGRGKKVRFPVPDLLERHAALTARYQADSPFADGLLKEILASGLATLVLLFNVLRCKKAAGVLKADERRAAPGIIAELWRHAEALEVHDPRESPSDEHLPRARGRRRR